ncbi:MAG: CdaR family protein [Clostridia bacterium]
MREWLKKYDILARVLAVIIAVVLWIYVVNVVDPVAELEISDIHPHYIGAEELLNARNLMVANEDQNLVKVTLRGARRDLAVLNRDDVKVEVDISKIKEAGSYKLSYKISVPNADVEVHRRSPNDLSVKLDKITTASVPVRVWLDGSIADGYVADEITSVPATITATGLQNQVSQIAYAKVTVMRRGINASILEQMRYEFYNSKDQALTLESVKTESDTVEVSMPILKVRELPLSIEIAEGGGALKKNASCKIVPETIKVAGEEKTIDALKSLMIGVIDLSKITDDGVVPLQITLPDNIKNMSGETSAKVEVKFNGLSKKTVKTSSIEVTNIPAGHKIEPVTNSLDVLLRGSEASLAKVLPQNVRVVVDLTTTVLSPGQHTISATVTVDGAADVGAVGDYKVVIKVS